MSSIRKLKYIHVSDSKGKESITQRDVSLEVDEDGNVINYPMEDIFTELGIEEDNEAMVVNVSSDEFGREILMILNSKYQNDVGGDYNFTLWRILPVFGDCALIKVGVINSEQSTIVDMDDESLESITKYIGKYKDLEIETGIRSNNLVDVRTKGKKKFIEDFNEKVQKEIEKLQNEGTVNNDDNRTGE